MLVALALAALMQLGLLGAPGSAAAAPSSAPNYTLGQVAYGPNSPITNCPGWSGDSDDAGHLYIVCPLGQNDYVLEFDATGHYLGAATLPPQFRFANPNGAGSQYAIDVAVSADGTSAYVSVGPNVDFPSAPPQGSIVRLTRAKGAPTMSFTYDANFVAGPWPVTVNGENRYTAARNVDVDASGRVYATTSFWVLELQPTTGVIVSRMGGGATTNGVGGAWIEGLNKPQGVAVAEDGNSLFVVEQQFSIVQRWVRTGPATWARDTTWGPHGNGLLGVPTTADDSYCTRNDTFQSPYDVAVDWAGDIYVNDVSCRRIQRFTSAGAYVQTVWTNDAGAAQNHGFAVNGQGSIVLPEPRTLLVRTDPAARPAPPSAPAPVCTDAAAPVLAAVSSVRRSTTRRVLVNTTTSDDCAGVTSMRISGARTGAAAWSPGTSQSIDLSGWNGTKRLVVQVRDGAGRVSAARALTVGLALPQPRLLTRATVNLPGRGCSATAPLRRVAGASAYRLADRCAALAGTVTRVTRSGRTVQVELLLPTAVAQRIYANAVGPVRLWVVTDSRSKVTRVPRVGRRASALGSVVALRNRTAAFGIPVDRLVGS